MRRVVVRPGIMGNSVEYMRVWIAGTFGAKFENSPLLAMLVIEKLDKLVGRISWARQSWVPRFTTMKSVT
jgi:hypothetical protein